MEPKNSSPIRVRPPLTLAQILYWADEWFFATGAWPQPDSGWIPATDEKWAMIDKALRVGYRGLAGGSGLEQLLREKRGHHRRGLRPELTESLILTWADAYHARHDEWPNKLSGEIPRTLHETWSRVDVALSTGLRGLPGGNSLSRLLFDRRDVNAWYWLSPLTEEQILGWADEYHTRLGEWPKLNSGAILGVEPLTTWKQVSHALNSGQRGLSGGSSLAKLLREKRGARYQSDLPKLSEELILSWATAYHDRTGKWPSQKSGPVAELPGSTWMNLGQALFRGYRGLRGGTTLAKLLKKHRGVRSPQYASRLSVEKILRWADAYFARKGRWPQAQSLETIRECPGTTWRQVTRCLRKGSRGLPGGQSFRALLAEHRGVRNPYATTPLKEDEIVAWAQAYRSRTGKWPSVAAGAIPESDGTNWNAVNAALEQGCRGLPGGSSLLKLLQNRGLR